MDVAGSGGRRIGEDVGAEVMGERMGGWNGERKLENRGSVKSRWDNMGGRRMMKGEGGRRK